jgi:hypothetical protein
LAREVLRDGADQEVLSNRTVGYDALAAAVEPFTLEHAAGVADVDAADLTELLAAVAAPDASPWSLERASPCRSART